MKRKPLQTCQSNHTILEVEYLIFVRSGTPRTCVENFSWSSTLARSRKWSSRMRWYHIFHGTKGLSDCFSCKKQSYSSHVFFKEKILISFKPLSCSSVGWKSGWQRTMASLKRGLMDDLLPLHPFYFNFNRGRSTRRQTHDPHPLVIIQIQPGAQFYGRPPSNSKKVVSLINLIALAALGRKASRTAENWIWLHGRAGVGFYGDSKLMFSDGLGLVRLRTRPKKFHLASSHFDEIFGEPSKILVVVSRNCTEQEASPR